MSQVTAQRIEPCVKITPFVGEGTLIIRRDIAVNGASTCGFPHRTDAAKEGCQPRYTMIKDGFTM